MNLLLQIALFSLFCLCLASPEIALIFPVNVPLVRILNGAHEAISQYWQLMLDNFSEMTIVSVFTFVLHETVYFGCYVPWLIIDQIPYFHKYKLQPTKVNDWAQQWRCLKRLLFAHVFIQFPMMMSFHFVVSLFGFRLTLPLPSFFTVFWQIMAFLVIEDFYFYWIHRFLHWKKIYGYIHKIHHEHAAPFGIAAEYAHPIETMLLGLGTILGPLLFARHMFTLWTWLVVRLWETVEDHSGYDIPWNPTNLIPFWGGPVHHDFHHKTFEGPYASIFSYTDYIFGTDKAFQEQQAKLAEGEGVSLSPFYPAAFRIPLPLKAKTRESAKKANQKPFNNNNNNNNNNKQKKKNPKQQRETRPVAVSATKGGRKSKK